MAQIGDRPPPAFVQIPGDYDSSFLAVDVRLLGSDPAGHIGVHGGGGPSVSDGVARTALAEGLLGRSPLKAARRAPRSDKPLALPSLFGRR